MNTMLSRQQITNQLLSAKTQAEKEGRHGFHEIISTVFNVARPLSIIALSQLIGQSNDAIRDTLRLLESVVRVPDDPHRPLQVGQNPYYRRLSNAEVDPPIYDAEADTKIAGHCLRVMGGLHANMCHLESYGTNVAHIPPKTIERSIPPGLAYACRFLVFHLRQLEDRAGWMDQLLQFLERHLLHLVETVTILERGGRSAVTMLRVLLKTFANNQGSPLMQFLHAARGFMERNWEVVGFYPLQLYASALVFEPDSSVIKRALHALPCWLDLAPRMQDPRRTVLDHDDGPFTGGHTGPVSALTLSPDGQLAASASRDHTAALWDVRTGALRHKLRGHDSSVKHVVFSSDGQLLASGGERDQSIRLWDTRTGRLQHTCFVTGRPRPPVDPFDGGMTRVVFSPDGRTLAVEICDDRVWLWDVATGVLRVTVDCCDSESRVLAFSPDGRRVTSGSKDHSIQMWDVATGALQQTLRGHGTFITDVAFSRDGRRLVSAGGDDTVRLWSTGTGVLQRTLRDCVDLPHVVGFSPDGRLVASGGYEDPLRLWDSSSGTLLHTMSCSPVENTLLIGGGASGRSSYIETDVGLVDIRRWLPGDASPYPEVSLQDQWIMYQGRREMHLPDESWSLETSVYRDGILALGYESGRVIFFGFGKE